MCTSCGRASRQLVHIVATCGTNSPGSLGARATGALALAPCSVRVWANEDRAAPSSGLPPRFIDCSGDLTSPPFLMRRSPSTSLPERMRETGCPSSAVAPSAEATRASLTGVTVSRTVAVASSSPLIDLQTVDDVGAEVERAVDVHQVLRVRIKRAWVEVLDEDGALRRSIALPQLLAPRAVADAEPGVREARFPRWEPAHVESTPPARTATPRNATHPTTASLTPVNGSRGKSRHVNFHRDFRAGLPCGSSGSQTGTGSTPSVLLSPMA